MFLLVETKFKIYKQRPDKDEKKAGTIGHRHLYIDCFI